MLMKGGWHSFPFVFFILCPNITVPKFKIYSIIKYLGSDPNLARLTSPLADEALHLVALGIHGGGVRRLLQEEAFSGQL